MTLPTPPEDGPVDPPLRGPLERAEPEKNDEPAEWKFSHESFGFRIFKRLEQGLERFRAVPV